MIHHTTHDPLTVFATTNFRGERRPFGIRDADRLLHTYLVGKTGTGKSTLLATFMRADLERGHGFALLDPHGDLAERVLDLVPHHRLADVIYLNPADVDFPMPFNVLESIEAGQRHLIASGLVSILKRFWADFWGPRSEYLVRNAVLALVEASGTTLLDMSRLLVDEPFRRQLLATVHDPAVLRFWRDEFEAYPPAFRQEAIAPVQNKIGEFLTTPLIRNIVGQRRNLFQIRALMDEGKVLIVNLSKGILGEDTAALLGSLVLTRLVLAAFSRADVAEHRRRPFFLYVDEFPSFATEGTFASLLSEARKYGLGAILANQYLGQLSDNLRSALFGNVGTLISFQAGAEDAPHLSREFGGAVSLEDITGLNRHEVYLRMAVAGVTTAPFSAITLPPVMRPTSYRQQIVTLTRERYTRPRAIVERGAERLFLESRGLEKAGSRDAGRCFPPKTDALPWPQRRRKS
ncbi:MAG: type IV secretion system DNA-binding domain-containing protein [Deltaproteobacteria bacterium]|nr:type IV secretion system DNA-binding domain-containing protein [Deltaproteobacteria bacterium]